MRGTSSTFDLAFVYVDLGDDFFKYATHMMVQSARKAMPGIRVVQLTDNATKHYPDADHVVAWPLKVEEICAFKGMAVAKHGLEAERPVIFSDVDILWRSAPPMPATGVNLLQRDGFPSMPFNTGVMLSASDVTAKRWWQHYQSVVWDMKKHGMGGWYCDQVAASIVGAEGLWMNSVAPTPEADTGVSPAVHFKGNRKELMAEHFGRL